MGNLDKMMCKIMIHYDDYIVTDHTLFGEKILPGAAYFDIIFRYLSNKGFDLSKIKIKNWIAMKAINVTKEFDKCLYIYFKKKNDHWEVMGKSKQVANGIVGLEEEGNFAAEVWEMDESERTHIDIQDIKNNATKQLDIDKLYEIAREKELVHGPFMKVQGQAYIAKEYILSELKLSEIGEQSLGKYIYHPAFVDASFFMIGVFLFDDTLTGFFKKDIIFIPMFLKEFIPIRKINQNKLYVYLKKEDLYSTESQGIFKCDIYFYDEEGNQLATIIGYTTKEVRDNMEISMDFGTKNNYILEAEGQDVDNHLNVVLQSREEIVDLLRDTIASRIKKEPEEINIEDEFFELGLDSMDLLEMVKVLESKLNVELYPTILIEYNSIKNLSNYLYNIVKVA